MTVATSVPTAAAAVLVVVDGLSLVVGVPAMVASGPLSFLLFLFELLPPMIPLLVG